MSVDLVQGKEDPDDETEDTAPLPQRSPRGNMPLPLLGGGRGSKQRAGLGSAARWAEGKAPR